MRAPETLSPIVAWRLWWVPATVPPVCLVVRVVVVVVVVVVAGARRVPVVRWPPPSSLVFKLGRAVVRVVRVVRGVVWWVRRTGMLIVWICL
jgi:hypothetical protein